MRNPPIAPNPEVEMNRPTGGSPEQEENVSPEEQAQYEQIVTIALEHLNSSEQAMEQMNNPDVPTFQAVGHAASMLARMIEGTAKRAGTELSEDAMYHAFVNEVVPEMIDIGESKGLFSFQSEEEKEETVAMAAMQGLKEFGEGMIQEGTAPQAEAQQFMGQLERQYGDS